MRGPRDAAEPVLITDAAPSPADELRSRKRRYTIMMLCRIPCLVLAGVFAHTWWLAVIFLAASVPLPWLAVMLANEGPALRSGPVPRLRPGQRRLGTGDERRLRGR
ncbi:DUF3099 domain-containing protein [Amycolatopsis sp. PS_44_ISF1]|uniref:DUF3099 domain-containing protein n=1 Tax=Amycolatopsis sp. PS_44_ISF1 TaxID=2974917 RepID=UPI0028DF27D3|nr:DUF3099 domain-containing protein [Amycolatopsis sp. PS_44_ISF1]MDT8915168.1 DUF3099 domain-containing protein [Amycolatopsis sp. PS_44_ISF1]